MTLHVPATLEPPPAPAIYAAPAGDDKAPGTMDAPVRTLRRALALGPDVVLGPGAYPAEPLLMPSWPGARTTIYAGAATLAGALFKRYTDLRITGGTWAGNLSLDQCATVTVENLDTRDATVRILNHCQGVEIRRWTARGGHAALAGPGRTRVSDTSENILVEQFQWYGQMSDGAQIGDWHDVTLRDGEIAGVRDPAGVIHNDCVQITGGVSRFAMERVLGIGASCFAMIQPNIRPVSDVALRDCVGVGQWSWSVQCQGVPRAVFERNVLRGKNGGLMLYIPPTGAPYALPAPDTLLIDNVLSSLRAANGCRAAPESARNQIG